MFRRPLRGIAATAAISMALIVAAAPPSMARDHARAEQWPTLSKASAAAASIAPLTPDVARTINRASTKVSPHASVSADATAADYERALSAYWTPERMRAARPIEQRLKDDTQQPHLAPGATVSAPTANRVAGEAAVTHKLRGKPLTVPPHKPETEPVPANVVTGSTGTATANAVAGAPSKPEYSVFHAVARTMGKVFLNHKGTDYVCSAGLVIGSGKSLVWTAGHCVYDAGAYAANWIFVPAYSDGQRFPRQAAPYGYWYARTLFAQTDWVTKRDWHGDVGAAIVWPNSEGKKIQDLLGAQGISFNLPYYPYSNAFGYPADPPYDGENLYQVVGQAYDAGASIIYMANTMTGGSSGGYWLTNFDGNWGTVNGHNSFAEDDSPYMYSPYYGRDTQRFYNSVQHLDPMTM
ncbi:hypothetical protein GCM10027280_15200 [Micromonospora polyrhachis]|uniref:V8-like Glu-specific endopeptidase n=1 Tax=Micromonospora polyrhachis TaxID=1282883 RepID=A0A7W7WPI6_9ACTN|nr:hypothetical protein [Micromonospora polyrhachis]MBB4958592.1 hypothetical protein [Micromonospora polyrhachis]